MSNEYILTKFLHSSIPDPIYLTVPLKFLVWFNLVLFQILPCIPDQVSSTSFSIYFIFTEFFQLYIPNACTVSNSSTSKLALGSGTVIHPSYPSYCFIPLWCWEQCEKYEVTWKVIKHDSSACALLPPSASHNQYNPLNTFFLNSCLLL